MFLLLRCFIVFWSVVWYWIDLKCFYAKETFEVFSFNSRHLNNGLNIFDGPEFHCKLILHIINRRIAHYTLISIHNSNGLGMEYAIRLWNNIINLSFHASYWNWFILNFAKFEYRLRFYIVIHFDIIEISNNSM